MNDENKIGLSIEMYEDLKETLVKAVKSTKANAGLEMHSWNGSSG